MTYKVLHIYFKEVFQHILNLKTMKNRSGQQASEPKFELGEFPNMRQGW